MNTSKVYFSRFSTEPEPIKYVYTKKGPYFKELAHILMKADESEEWNNRMETQEGGDVIVLVQKLSAAEFFFAWGKSFVQLRH